MKKLLLIAFITIFYGCSKSGSNPSPVKPTNWIMGKWNATLYGDSVFYVNGNKTFIPITTFKGELNFTDSSHVIYTGSTTAFNYSLSNMTASDVDFTTGAAITFNITRLSDNQIKLYRTFYNGGDPTIKTVGFLYLYTKEQ